jgi:hypothetical protein
MEGTNRPSRMSRFIEDIAITVPNVTREPVFPNFANGTVPDGIAKCPGRLLIAPLPRAETCRLDSDYYRLSLWPTAMVTTGSVHRRGSGARKHLSVWRRMHTLWVGSTHMRRFFDGH